MNDQQYKITKKASEKFDKALRDLQQEMPVDETEKLLQQVMEDAIKSQNFDLKAELLGCPGATYYVHSTDEKVYIESAKGCLARLCNLSAEFYQDNIWIDKCTFKQFQEEALKRGFVIEDKHCPEWAK
jgi:hypothetical protein